MIFTKDDPGSDDGLHQVMDPFHMVKSTPGTTKSHLRIFPLIPKKFIRFNGEILAGDNFQPHHFEGLQPLVFGGFLALECLARGELEAWQAEIPRGQPPFGC